MLNAKKTSTLFVYHAIYFCLWVCVCVCKIMSSRSIISGSQLCHCRAMSAVTASCWSAHHADKACNDHLVGFSFGSIILRCFLSLSHGQKSLAQANLLLTYLPSFKFLQQTTKGELMATWVFIWIQCWIWIPKMNYEFDLRLSLLIV